jgi:hypothetical protein
VLAIICLVILTNGTSLAFLLVNEYNWLAFMMPLMWGVLDSAINTHIFGMLGFEFDTNSEPFSVFTLIEALSVFVFSVINTWIDTRMRYIYYISALGVMGIIMIGTTYFFDFK